MFLFWAAIYIVIAILEYVIQSGLTIRWRQWLTDHYVSEWLGDGTHYRMALSGDAADNPDQRIAVDIDRFIDQTYGFSITLLATRELAGILLDHPVDDLGQLHDPRNGDRHPRPAVLGGARLCGRGHD